MPPRLKKTKAFQKKVKNAKRANDHGPPFGVRHSLDFLPFDGAASPRHRHVDGRNFTLEDEARHSDRSSTFWSTDQRLRHKTVNFISAGAIDPLGSKPRNEAQLELQEDSSGAENALARMNLHSPKHSTAIGTDHTVLGTASAIEAEPKLCFVIDTVGELTNSCLPLPKVRSSSPTPSDSSEEVILFRGRDRNGNCVTKSHGTAKSRSISIEEKLRRVEDKIHDKEKLLEEALDTEIHEKEGLLEKMLKEESASPPMSATTRNEVIVDIEASQERRHQEGHRSSRKSKHDEDAILADYVANMDQDDCLLSNIFRLRDLGDAENGVWQDTHEVSPQSAVQLAVDGWDREDIDDFGDLSTSDEVMGKVEKIYDKRKRKNGMQYLVIWENSTLDEARWVPTSTLLAAGASAQIESFENEERLMAEFQNESAEEDTSNVEGDGIDDDLDEDNDDADLIQRKIDRMSDEQIARLLAKQEELGMGSDELVLFGGEADDGFDMDADLPDRGLNSFLLESGLIQPRHRVARRPRGEFSSATALADSYDGFDIMDFERPSLQKSKGRRGRHNFDFSDSEFEASMQAAFESDRAKKKALKQEREELRAQGLLGKKNGKLDLKQKYKEGMGIHEVKEEIKAFLMTDNTTLTLPPMDKADRRVVHELGNALALKTKSIGSGRSRFPILTKTQRTPRYFDATFDAIEARISRRFLPRRDISSKKQKGVRGGGNNAGVSYKDGDVVGGSAPQIGVGNKGHTMLAKMGWSTGTALGALGNKGRLEPVSHVVKTTKAGLG